VEADLTQLLLSKISPSFLSAKPIFACLALMCMSTVAVSAQNDPTPTVVFLPNQMVRIANLPSLTAQSSKTAAVLATTLETILDDKDLCCGKDSGLEDAVLSSPSLKELSAKVQGRHVLGDGLSVMVRAEYYPQSSVGAGTVIGTLMRQQPMLIEWKSRVYVLYGAVFDETRIYDRRVAVCNPQTVAARHKILRSTVGNGIQERNRRLGNNSGILDTIGCTAVVLQ
jgi:hypothetical protein